MNLVIILLKGSSLSHYSGKCEEPDQPDGGAIAQRQLLILSQNWWQNIHWTRQMSVIIKNMRVDASKQYGHQMTIRPSMPELGLHKQL